MFDFNLDEIEAANSVVPKGTYLVQVEKAELSDTKSGGQMIKVQFNIVGEVQNGRKLFEQYNIANENPVAVQIGLWKIKGLVVASGANLSKFQSPDQLIGLECLAAVKEVSDDYGDKNEITSFKKPTSAAPVNSPIAEKDLPQGADGKPIF
jgi:hypothetical protein